MPIIFLVTVLSMSALYAPQPLLPILAAEFSVSSESAALLTTIALLPLAVAPLFYGYLLESISPRRMLKYAVLLLALSELLFFAGETFPFLIGIRFFQGLLIPALLTALMTYVSRITSHGEVSRAMAGYIAATIVGGFLGRAASGFIASTLGWRAVFLVLALSLLGAFFLLGRLGSGASHTLVRPTPGAVLEVLRRPHHLRIYLVVFCFFLVFAAVMNFIPFRLTEISEEATALRIGLMYAGYLMGIATALGAVRVCRLLGGERRTILVGLSVFAVSLAGLIVERPEFLFVDMFLFCGAMFLVHSTTSGLLNQKALTGKGIVNGLYVAFYYSGGTIGSWLPGFIYRIWGWETFIAALLAVAVFAVVLAWGCRVTGKSSINEGSY